MNFEQFFAEQILKKKGSVLDMRKSKPERITSKFNRDWDVGMARWKKKVGTTMSPGEILSKNKKKASLQENAQILLKGLESLYS